MAKMHHADSTGGFSYGHPALAPARKKKSDAGGAKPNPKAPLGQGGRFAAVEAAAAKSGARNPAAVAAAVGRKKYGNKKMAAMAAAGKKK